MKYVPVGAERQCDLMAMYKIYFKVILKMGTKLHASDSSWKESAYFCPTFSRAVNSLRFQDNYFLNTHSQFLADESPLNIMKNIFISP